MRAGYNSKEIQLVETWRCNDASHIRVCFGNKSFIQKWRADLINHPVSSVRVWQSFETVYRVINIKGSGRIKFVLGAKLMICVDKRPQLS
jgi:hypothetical protein